MKVALFPQEFLADITEQRMDFLGCFRNFELYSTEKVKVSKEVLKQVLAHLKKEMECENVRLSLEKGFEYLSKAHNAIHEVMYLAPLSLPEGANWHSKSAFLVYHWDAFHRAHSSLLEALRGQYNSAYTLLRNTLELVIRGAFRECLAHKEYRERAVCFQKSKRGKKLLSGLSELFGANPLIEENLEKTSATIFDFVKPDSRKEYTPLFREMVQQLAEWGIFEPIVSPSDFIYERLYRELSQEVHIAPDKSDIGRRLVVEREAFKTEVIPEELAKYSSRLLQVSDIATVVELNILEDWIEINKPGQEKLKERLKVLKDLELHSGAEKLERLVGK